MDPRRWQRVKELFEAAWDRPPGERAAFIADRCGDDVELREEVQSLLEQAAVDDGFIDAPALGEGFTIPAPAAGEVPTVPRPDSRIGSYRLVRLIGRGGMGAVYEAEQENPYRLVAIKILDHVGGDERARHDRFQREVDALARLAHPGIAAIHEAGRTEDGRDYLVMELVRGPALHRYLDAARPERRARIDLFIRLCDAVNAAHQRGVIHRDLKPANILVEETAEGDMRPKVLDFGLARMSDADVRMATQVTEIGSIMGTLPYMSPEQARGDPHEIDIRSDVYALGVILYEMLCERRPYDLPERAVPEAIRVICDVAPTRPGTVDRRLRGDLETIVLAALEKEPQRRYQSAAALADDLRRHLADEPIVARPPSATYHLGKFVRRHRLPVALAVVLLLTALAFGVIGTAQAVRLGRANRAAAEQGERREQVLYASRIARAQLLYDDHNLLGLRQVLAACDPERRGWEWHWLSRLAEPAAATLQRDEASVRAAGLADGRIILAVRRPDGGIDVEMETGGAAELALPPSPVTVVAFSPDGRRVAAGTVAGTVVIREDEGRARTVEVLDAPVGLLRFDRASRRLLVLEAPAGHGERGSRIRLIEPDGGVRTCERLVPPGTTAVGIDHDLEMIAIGRDDGVVDVRRLPDGSLVSRSSVPTTVTALEFMPGGDELAVALLDRSVRLWAVRPPAERLLLSGHRRAVVTMAAAPDGRHLATGDGGGTLRVWRTENGREVLAVPAHGEAAWSLTFSPDGTQVLSRGDDGQVRLWAVATDREPVRPPAGVDPRVFAFGADGAAATYDLTERRVHVVEARSGAALDTFDVPDERVTALAFAGDGRLAVGGDRGQVWLRDGGRLAGLRAGDGATSPVSALAFSAGGRWLAAGHDDGRIRLGEAGSAAAPRCWPGHEKAIRSLVVDEARGRVVSASKDGLIRIWAMADGTLQRTMAGHEDYVHAIDLHPDGRRLLSASADGTVRLWDADDGSPLRTLLGHEGAVLSARWNADGTRIVSAGTDVTVRLWSPVQDQPLLSLRWPGHFVSDVRLEDDGRCLVARSLKGWIRSWCAGP